MFSVWLDLLPLIVGAAVVPVVIIIALFLLRSAGGLLKAAAFVGGAIIMRLVQGLLFGVVFNTSAATSSSTGGPGPVVSTLLMVIGILMLITAFKQWRKEDDPDAPPPKWMAMLSGLSTLKAFGIGAATVGLAAKQWAFTLSAIGVIKAAPLTTLETIVSFLFFVLAASSLVLIPIILYAVAPTGSAKTLDAVQKWLERHNRVIVIVVSLVFGVLFLWKGISGLMG